jgi:hypothetical protein
MNSLAFDISPSPGSNDHQVRIVIDGEDWLQGNNLGIDPPEFFAQKALRDGGELLIGRCDCGCVGCADIRVEVARKEPGISWTVREGIFYFFSAKEYDRTIKAAESDTAWEDANRTAERLVAELFRGATLEDGHIFDWASARIGRGLITLSFSLNKSQKTFDFGWDGQNPETALPGAKSFYRERVEQNAAPNP